MSQENDEVEIDLREIFGVIKSKIVLLLVVTIIFGLGGFVGSRMLIKPTYSSTAKIYVLGSSGLSVNLSALQMGSSLASDYMELIMSRPVMEEVIEDLDLKEDYKALSSKISITNPTDTRILKITVTYDDARVAKSIADDFVKVASKKIVSVMNIEEPTIVEPAYLEEEKVGPSNVKNGILAALVALCLTIAIIVLRFILDDKVKNTEDVTRYLGLNTLAMIPDDIEGQSTKKKGVFSKHKAQEEDE